MAEYVLGLDLGPTSIGWALVDEAGERIIASGVRIFPEGVDRDQKGGELSKNAQRRTARGMRRQIARRARRKRRLRTELIGAGLLPADDAQRQQLFALDPYELRRRGLHEALSLHELGRALAHLCQRRGFLSNRKTDRQSEADSKGMLGEISQLAADIEAAGHATLGEHLAALARDPHQRIRGRHTRRAMYQHEFDLLWQKQKEFYPVVLTDDLRARLYDAIFFQRAMFWPASSIGRCELEPREKRCLRADRQAQRFRLLQEVNNLRVLERGRHERPLTDEERAKLIKYLSGRDKAEFSDLAKQIGLMEHDRFNLERGERKKLLGLPTDHALRRPKLFGKSWDALSEEQRDQIVLDLLDPKVQDETLRQRAMSKWGLTEEQAQAVIAANLMEGRMSFSRRAIDKLLPHLERGLPLMSDDGTPSALSEAGYLRPDQRPRNIHNRLPKPPELPNPIVRQALFETRKVLNAIISEYGAPREIRIELAREMKAGAKARETMNKQRWERERKNSDARSFLEEQGWPCKPNDVRRYALWKEQSELCVYTGQQIRLSQLFGGEVDIDHILPYPRSLDNSLMNKVVCFRFANAEKADQTPREWLEQSQPDRYEQVLQRVRGLPYPKRLRFARETCELDDFVARQLVDTAYITRSVAQYLRCLGCSIVCGKGQMTAELRHQWGLDTVLRDDGLNKKNREDHRHHAVDALVVALTNRSRLQQLARGHHQSLEPWAGFRQQAEDNIKSILVSHRARRRVRGALHSATVYGTTQKKGSAENVDRPWARNWVEESMVYVRRKPVASIDDTKQMSKVRDATIRELLKQYLRDERRIDPNQPQKLKPKDWEPLPCMISRKGQRIPIKRVRMLEEGETFRELRANAFVKPDANHHIVYYEMPGGKEPSWSAEVVTRWDAVQRVRAGLPAVDRASSPTKKFLMSLSIGDTFTFERDGIEFLSVVQKLDQRSKRVTYKLHTDARRSTEVRKDNLYLSVPRMREFKARKVVVDYLGRLRWAND